MKTQELRVTTGIVVAVALAVVAAVVWYRFESGRSHGVDTEENVALSSPTPWPPATGAEPLRLAPPPPATDLSTRYRVDIRDVPQRPVERADFAVNMYVGRSPRACMLVHDPATRRMARFELPMLDDRPYELAGLTDGGRRALLVAQVGRGAARRVALLTLRTGELRWFDSDPATYGGISPTVAGEPGGIAWSPDQRHLAASYLDADPREGGDDTTVVFDANGRLERTFPLGTSITPSSNAAWLTASQLIVNTSTELGTVVDITTGARHHLDTGGIQARSGGWFVAPGERREGDPTTLVRRPITGGPARPWLAISGPLWISGITFA